MHPSSTAYTALSKRSSCNGICSRFQIEFAVELFDDSTIRDLRERVAEKSRIPARNLLFMQLLLDTEGGFGSVYADSDSIASLLDDLRSRGNSRFVTCLETPKPKKTSEHGEHIMIIWSVPLFLLVPPIGLADLPPFR